MNKKEFLKCLANPPYEMITLDTGVLIIPRETYQRDLQTDEVKEIIAQFSPYLLNEPKVSFRNGKYYVFDGQHTIISLLEMNEGKNLQIRCKVYYGMTEQEEAKIFSMQTGAGRKLSPADKIRAEITSVKTDLEGTITDTKTALEAADGKILTDSTTSKASSTSILHARSISICFSTSSQSLFPML